MAFRPASKNTAVNEPPRQMLNRITLAKAHAPAPRAPSTACFTLPIGTLYEVISGGLSIQNHATTVTPPGYAQGRNTARNASARPRDGVASRSASAIPTASLATLVTAK